MHIQREAFHNRLELTRAHDASTMLLHSVSAVSLQLHVGKNAPPSALGHSGRADQAVLLCHSSQPGGATPF